MCIHQLPISCYEQSGTENRPKARTAWRVPQSTYSKHIQRKSPPNHQRQNLPRFCLPKYITASIDADILADPSYLGAHIKSTLLEAGIQTREHTPSHRSPPHSITWQRSTEPSTSSLRVGDNAEDYALLVWSVADLSASLKSNTLDQQIRTAQERINRRPATLLVCATAAERQRWQHKIDRAMIRVHLMFNIGYQLVNSAADLAQIVLRFTKSVAEAPNKRKATGANDGDDCGFYAANDNRDCVVVRAGIGLGNLWQQQLCKLPLASLETAQAIIGEYAMPRLLLDAYGAGGDGDLLSAIPVRRTAGAALSTARKIGPELSGRIHQLYTSDDPDQIL